MLISVTSSNKRSPTIEEIMIDRKFKLCNMRYVYAGAAGIKKWKVHNGGS